ncbi:hypothetical protein MCP1_200041 [Candidatus Terasakiella magnetica]|nr:hypothetical protein MCP1_200041 [Candidatus Terasakiella magnetica]
MVSVLQGRDEDDPGGLEPVPRQGRRGAGGQCRSGQGRYRRFHRQAGRHLSGAAGPRLQDGPPIRRHRPAHDLVHRPRRQGQGPHSGRNRRGHVPAQAGGVALSEGVPERGAIAAPGAPAEASQGGGCPRPAFEGQKACLSEGVPERGAIAAPGAPAEASQGGGCPRPAFEGQKACLSEGVPERGAIAAPGAPAEASQGGGCPRPAFEGQKACLSEGVPERGAIAAPGAPAEASQGGGCPRPASEGQKA